MNVVIPTLNNILLRLRRFYNRYWRYSLLVFGWIVVAFVPLVSFDAGGGQTAIEIIRYVVFRGLDRDVWYSAGWLFVLSGATAATAVLAGMVLYTVGLVFMDRTLAFWGCGVVFFSLLVVIWAARPVATVEILGAIALPHLGWFLALVHVGFAVWSLWMPMDSTPEEGGTDIGAHTWVPALLSRSVGRWFPRR